MNILQQVLQYTYSYTPGSKPKVVEPTPSVAPQVPAFELVPPAAAPAPSPPAAAAAAVAPAAAVAVSPAIASIVT